MELTEAIRTRRSVRRYAGTPVPKDAIRELLEMAVQAPSAMNSQPWAFGVIEGIEALRAYSDRAKVVCLARLETDHSLERYRSFLSDPAFNIFYGAPAAVCIYARLSGPFAKTDCAMAAQNLMLSAHGLGLATCWVGFAHWLFDSPEVKEELGVPAGYTAVGQFALGYPAGQLPSPPSRKPPELLFWR